LFECHIDIQFRFRVVRYLPVMEGVVFIARRLQLLSTMLFPAARGAAIVGTTSFLHAIDATTRRPIGI